MNKFTQKDSPEQTGRTRKTKRWFGWLSFCMMVLIGQLGFAQTGTIQIGSGTQTATGTAAIPVTNYSFNYNQQIVTATEYGLAGGGAGLITKIRYKPTVIGTVTVWNDWTVYIGHTTKTAFASTTDWVPLSDLTQVFSGIVTTNPVVGEWFEITFTTPFNYTGGNIVVAIDENTPNWTTSPAWSAYTSTPNSGIYYRTDTVADNPNPASPPTATGLTAILPQIQFEGTFATCMLPSNLVASNITDNSADLGWTEVNSATSWDIEWGLKGFTPTGTPTITGTITNPHNLTGLDSNTKYDFYVRSNCGTDGTSLWAGPYTFKTFACLGAVLDITSVNGDEICNEGTLTLSTTASGTGDNIYWYDAQFGGNLVGMGTSFATPFLTATTSYWAAEVLLDNEIFTGQGNLSPTTLGSTTAGGITFTLNQTASILSFEARSTTAAGGAVTYALIDVDNGNSVLMTHDDVLPGGGTATVPTLYTVNLNFLNIPPGNYRLVKQSGAATAYMTGAFPYPLGTVGQVVNGAGSATTTSTLYYHFFNITIEGIDVICESDREEVIATVHEIIDIDVTATETTIDFGDSTTLSVSSANSNYEYVWTWDGGTATGVSVTVSPAQHTTYTVTATDSVTGCQNESEIEILVYDMTLCDSIEITDTTDGSVCDEGTVTLSATASGTGDNIYWYDAAVGGNKVGQGASFETPELTETTSYWAAEVYLDDGSIGGQAKPTYTAATTGNSTSGANWGLMIDAYEPFTIVDVEVFSTGAGGDITIQLQDSAGTLVPGQEAVITIPGGGTPTVPVPYTAILNFEVPNAGTYRLVRTSSTTVNMLRETSGNSYPYPLGTVGQIPSGFITNPGSATYYWFYNWTVSTAVVICESDREEVIASVHETIGIDVTATETDLLPGESTTLTASSTNSNYEYVWTWDGGTATGASVTVSPTAVSTIYTVTATDTITGCQTQGSVEIFTFDLALCDDLEIATTTDGSVCGPGTTTTLQATGNSGITDSQIFWYDAPTGGNKVGTGSTFTTPALTTTTSYYAAEVLTDGAGVGGTITTSYTAGGLTFFAATTGVGITFAVQNTNSIPVTLDGLDFYMNADTNQSYQLWYNPTTITGVPGIINTANGWVSIVGPLNVIPAGTTNGIYPVFTGIDFEIPANTTYRFALTGTGTGNFTYYNDSGAPNSFSSEGINLLVGNNNAGGTGNVGYSGQNPYTTGITTNPRFFHGALSFNSATILCESDREEVTATVYNIIGIDVTATETTIDAGDNTTLTASSTNSNYEYVWTWDGGTDTGASITVSPTEHTTYTVTATDTVTGCQTSEEIEILVYDLTLCDSIEILTTTNGSICSEGTVTLSATASGTGDNIYWYDAEVGGNKIGQGTTFTTPELTETTSYWASEVYLDNGGGMLTGQGKVAWTGPSPTGNTGTGGLAFSATESFVIEEVTLYSNTTAGGNIPSIQLQTITGTLIAEINNIPVPAAPGTGVNALAFQVPLNFEVPGQGNYRLLIVGTIPSLIRDTGAAQAGTFPYPLGTSGEIYGSILTFAEPTLTTYYYFYNWTISADSVICESEREEVTATVHTIDIVATATTIDPGDSATLTASSSNPNYEYVWTWDGGTATGASITVTPATHTTYTVTATDTTAPGCQNSAEITIIVFNTAMCDVLEITSTTDGGICESGTTVLQATSSGTGDNIYWYDAPTGGNLVGQGANFTTPNLTATTSFWASEVLLENGGGTLSGLGQIAPSQAISATSNSGLFFTATEPFTLVSVEVHSNTAAGGLLEVSLRDINNGNIIINTATIMLPPGGSTAAPIPVTVPLNFQVAPGSYRIIKETGVGMAYNGATTGAPGFPYLLGSVGTITGGATLTGTSTLYYYFYNWTISTGLLLCESDREEVIATVVPASTTPAPTGPANQLVYAGTTLAGLNVTGTALTWYSDAALTNEIPDTTLAYEGMYYVTQTLGYCEGAALAVTVTLHCPTPNNLSTGTVTLNSAVLTWQGNGISSDIQYGASGFTLGTGTEINDVSGTSYPLGGLTPDTFYDFYVRQDCGTDGISNWGGPYTFFTGYCVVASTNTTYGIGNFTTTGGILNINNSTGAGTYSNYTAQSVAQFVGGAPVQFTITTVTGTAGMGIWIDWNNNMVFDSGEQVYASGTAYINPGTGSITIPAGTPVGNYRMRVVANWLSTSPTPCGNLGNAAYGEAEDYTFMVIDPPACMPPIGLTADVTATSANLGWTSTGTLFDIKWGVPGFNVDTQGTLIDGVTDNPYLLSGLDPSTSYQYYVRQDCGTDDGVSLWSGPFTFTTLCVPVSVLNENFDGVTAGTNVLPVCWSKIGTSAAYVNTTAPFSAPNNLYMYKSTNIDNYLVTPYLDNLADNTHWLRFRARTTSTATTTLTVGYLTDVTDAGTFVEIETITFTGTAYPTTDFVIFPWNLPTNAKHLAFRNNTNLRTIYLDDIHWEAAPTCMYPMSLSSSNISASSTILSWAGTGTLYDIEYGLSGFTPGTGTTIPGVTNPYTLTGLTGGATYQYYVRQDCGSGDYSTWSGPHTFIPGTYTGNIPTMLNANPQVDDIACATSFAIDVPPGQQIASLTVQYIMTSSSPAWDSHQRSVLYSPSLGIGEAQVATHPAPQDFAGIGYYNRDVTFANGQTGTIEFQLKAWRTTGGAGCGTNLVYVEDGSWILNATFEDIPSCPNPPADLGYANPTEDSVDLVWTSDESGTFEVKWGNIGFNLETEGNIIPGIDGFTHTLSGLDSSIPYEFYVRRDCSTVDEEDFGDWVGPVRFNAGHCIPYTNNGHYFTLFNTTNAVENVSYTYTDVALGIGYVNTNMIITEDAGETFNFTSNYVGGTSGLRIWVDWNNNFIFEDDEQVFFLTGGGAKNGTITIPVGTPGGDYRMRVRAQSGANTPPACGLIATGEALDFTLRVSCEEVDAPTGNPTQPFDEGDTLADLDVTGDNLVWYADEDLTIVLDPTTVLVDNTTYYVVSTNGVGCQSDALAVTVEQTSSTSDFNSFGFRYYPNPVSEQLYLSANAPISDIKVINMLGQQVNAPANSDNTNVDMSGLPTGNYLIQVTIEGVSKMLKVVKK